MIGLVTIGQTPRDDIVGSMFASDAMPPVCEAGGLDGISRGEIDELRPETNEHVLVTRLADGTEVTVGKERLVPFVQRAVDMAVDRGANAICVLCTGAFDGLRSPVPLVYPDRVLVNAVNAVKPDGTIGVLMPHAAQHESMVIKWSRPNRTVVTGAVSPYGGGLSFEDAARSLKDRGAELLVMDCMGFDRDMQARAIRAVDVPVVLANALVGAVLQEVFRR